MDIDLDAGPIQPHWIDDAVLAVDDKVLPDQMDDSIFGRQINGLGVLDRVLNIFFHDLPIMGNNGMTATIVETTDVAASHPKINTSNFHVRHLFSFDDGIANVFACD